MRNNDEQLRHFTPLLRRIVVIVALLTAAPVVLWSITAFVRSYVGPPQLPSFRRLAAARDAAARQRAGQESSDRNGDQPAAQAPADPTSSAPTVEARATTTDARGDLMASDGQGSPAPPSAPAPANPSNITTTIPSVVTDAAAKPSDRFIDRIPPDVATETGALASNQPAAADASPADAMPAAEPLHGPIPLPRQRPRIFAMAQLTASAGSRARIRRARPGAAAAAGISRTAGGRGRAGVAQPARFHPGAVSGSSSRSYRAPSIPDALRPRPQGLRPAAGRCFTTNTAACPSRRRSASRWRTRRRIWRSPTNSTRGRIARRPS